MVADLQDRHAKEIFVGDVDADGTDELYVVVEGHVGKDKRLEHGVQVRRYQAGTSPLEGVVIAEVKDLSRRAGVEPSSVRYPQERLGEVGLTRRSVRFSVDGDYAGLRRFINFL